MTESAKIMGKAFNAIDYWMLQFFEGHNVYVILVLPDLDNEFFGVLDTAITCFSAFQIN